jgi:AcrR family transcriptional regulator
MIHQTFYRLPEAKRRLILDSLIAEFTLRPPADARISAVVELAGISRGSFYQYFDGMSDAEIAVLHYLGAQRYAELAALIRSGHGDLFSALAQLFRREMERSKDPGFAALLRNLSLPRTFVPAANRAGLPDAPDPLELLSALDLAVFRLPDIRFAMETVDLATGALERLLRSVLEGHIPREDAEKACDRVLDIIRLGALSDPPGRQAHQGEII